MKKVRFCVGLNDKDSKRQEIGTLDAYKIAGHIFARYVGGATIQEGRGYYTHDDGTIIFETSLICDVYGEDVNAETVAAVADALRIAFNQESILIEKTETDAEFFRG